MTFLMSSCFYWHFLWWQITATQHVYFSRRSEGYQGVWTQAPRASQDYWSTWFTILVSRKVNLVLTFSSPFLESERDSFWNWIWLAHACPRPWKESIQGQAWRGLLFLVRDGLSFNFSRYRFWTLVLLSPFFSSSKPIQKLIPILLWRNYCSVHISACKNDWTIFFVRLAGQNPSTLDGTGTLEDLFQRLNHSVRTPSRRNPLLRLLARRSASALKFMTKL